MSAEYPPPGELALPRQFLVTIPPDDEAGLAALHELASNAPGRQLTEALEPTVPHTPFDLAMLSEISHEHWGTPIYGETAASLLTVERAKLETSVMGVPGNTNYGLRFNFERPGGYHQDLKTNINEPAATIYADVRRLLDAYGTPVTFSASLVSRKDRSEGAHGYVPILALHPGDFTMEALTAFVETRRYAQHTLHGTLGRALDTMCLATGALEQPRVVTTPPRPGSPDLITHTQLAAGRTVGADAYKLLWRKVNETLKTQTATGAPAREGELIIEGECSVALNNSDPFSTPSTVFTYAQLVRSSLGAVRKQYGNRLTPMTHYLDSLIRY